VQAIFGMNINEIVPDTHGSLVHYFETALPLTFVTVWAVMAFQSKHLLGQNTTMWMRVFWPVWLIQQMIKQRKRDAAYNLDARWKDEDLKN
jgi:hypothetical protein